MPEHEKATLAASIALPFNRVTFDAVKAIVTPADITRREDVEAWRTMRRTLSHGGMGVRRITCLATMRWHGILLRVTRNSVIYVAALLVACVAAFT